MNWEKSKSLTPLKKDFLKSFFNKNQDFYLTGGSALSIFYFDHRFSYDLDLFTDKDRIKYANYSKDKSKTILATQFLQKIESGDLKSSNLEAETIENFKEIFKKLKEILTKK